MPDLGIGIGADSHRPNILVAWRNTQKILEVEVLVRNLGSVPGKGRVWLDLADETGKTLFTTEPLSVSVPAAKDGGEEGVIHQSKGFKMMNLMFDQLDRLNQRYKLRAHVETEGVDANPLDNVACKAFNADSRALPNTLNFYRYQFINTTNTPITGTIRIDHNTLPNGWVIQAAPEMDAKVTLKPGEVFTGALTVHTPEVLHTGDHVDFQVSLVGSKDGSNYVIDQDEWFLVSDSTPPDVGQPTVVTRPDGSAVVNVVAYDPICGIKEASGVQVAYSLDGGVTFSTRVLAYTRGNFYNRTWFEGTLGPFPPGTTINAVVTVSNNAGVIKRFNLDQIKIASSVASNG